MTKEVEVKVVDYCPITRRGSVYRDRYIKVKSNHKTFVLFHNLHNYGSHLFMQYLSKLNFEINVIPNELEKYLYEL